MAGASKVRVQRRAWRVRASPVIKSVGAKRAQSGAHAWRPRRGRRAAPARVAPEKKEFKPPTPAEGVDVEDSPEQTTEKYGLEVGLFKTLMNKGKSGESKKADARGLLKKYGSAYLVTSISFAVVSFALCYVLVSAGIDVSALLQKVGIEVNLTSERVGKIAIAYAAHKAASPIRFPPTVALTPVVANWLGKGKGGKKGGEDA